jgi:hypothetical protein
MAGFGEERGDVGGEKGGDVVVGQGGLGTSDLGEDGVTRVAGL